MADRLEHLVGEPPAERLALAVDVEVVATGEVDPLEGAGGTRARRGERRLGDGAAGRAYVLLDDVIAMHIGDLFPGTRILGVWAFRVTRNFDLNIHRGPARDRIAPEHGQPEQ